MATYFSGSGKIDYDWHREKLKKFLTENKDYDFTKHTDAFERLYFEEETSIPYVTAAIILERTNRIYRNKRLTEIRNGIMGNFEWSWIDKRKHQ